MTIKAGTVIDREFRVHRYCNVIPVVKFSHLLPQLLVGHANPPNTICLRFSQTQAMLESSNRAALLDQAELVSPSNGFGEKRFRTPCQILYAPIRERSNGTGNKRIACLWIANAIVRHETSRINITSREHMIILNVHVPQFGRSEVLQISDQGAIECHQQRCPSMWSRRIGKIGSAKYCECCFAASGGA